MNPLSSINNPVNSGAVLADAYGVSGTKAGVGSATGIQGINADASASSTNTVTKDDHGLVLSGRAERAQKIEAMAKDFFQDGSFSSEKLPSLIQRLYKDGILSDGQLNRLTNSGFDIPPTEAQSLADFIDEQRATLTNSDEDRELAGTLDEAKWVMRTMDSIQSPAIAQKANRVATDITALLGSERPLTDQQKHQYQGIKSLMQLASMTGEHQQASGQLNSYLALAKQH
ncbi:hypothetical protein CXF83_15675 [Shewanella sp. Choline-02u-19]|jgi:hypothetical protein|uniref:hypothetical protein n=1 Tax=unclassified Shewanella TaxID=196818 RepID=UPI000C34DDCF|nr:MULTISPECIES: hypothetical protein [unclassified Shewanella]PKG58215.1 hypothetical protein CXF82_05615 [Shewanella sp. GutDb-MelDb]PKG73454.1 hypothetical protein CXF86_17210 [Shewanella sp. GutCb]PKH60960.1 hypothetical protein CXF84_01730 [Shewanella sp. Bg11-22]PKI28053.1 hypothetical protein CXF83_15675 [Shewanella sp. Choline-02u-19]